MARIPGNNTTAKILCLILAAILWIYVMNEQNPPVDSTFTVPLEVRSLPEGYMAIDAPEVVRVKVRGPRSIVAGALPKDLKTYVDAKGLKEGRHNLLVYAQAPASLEVVEVNPDRLNLRIDAAYQRQFPVEIKLTGTATTGSVVVKATSSVASVTVEGARSLVDAVDKVIAIIDLTGKNADFNANVSLVAVNHEGKGIEGLAVNPNKAVVTLNMVKGPYKKIVDIKPTIYGELGPGITLKRITTDPEKIEISGEANALQKIDFVYTEPVNLTGINQDSTKDVRLQLKEGIVTTQDTISVKIAVEPTR
jgi:YbbR domain-containing protein